MVSISSSEQHLSFLLSPASQFPFRTYPPLFLSDLPPLVDQTWSVSFVWLPRRFRPSTE